MRKENNYQKSSISFRQFVTLCLKDIYQDKKVVVKRETIDYTLYDDSDFSTISEHMIFEMSDNRKFEVYYQYKGQKYFHELLSI
jgi:hypothetical protein